MHSVVFSHKNVVFQHEREREMQSEAKSSKRSVMASEAIHSKMSQARYFQGVNNSSNNNSGIFRSEYIGIVISLAIRKIIS